MSAQTLNFVQEVFIVMDTLSGIQNGMTISEVQKTMPYCTRGEVVRVLDTLEGLCFAYHEVKPHGRTGKKVYHLTETAAIHCASIARQYSEKK